MDNQLLTLSKIFSERLFRIPDYQRGYAWGEKQLKDFWNDIDQLAIGRNHYTGVLTLENVPERIVNTWEDDGWIIFAKNYSAYYVVDGQQRLTTAIILLRVILEKTDINDKLNYTDCRDIEKKFIADSRDAGISRSYIFGYDKENPSYDYLKQVIFGERPRSGNIKDTIYTQNLSFAKSFFTTRVDAMAKPQIELLYRKLTQQLLFNIFVISDDVDVCVAFETMNNRGKPLSQLELLKNRLIFLTVQSKDDVSERNRLRRNINHCWREVYHSLGQNKENPLKDDEFLLNHYILYFGRALIPQEDKVVDGELLRRLFSEEGYSRMLLERKFIAKNLTDEVPPEERLTIPKINTYVTSLQESVTTWYAINNPLLGNFPTSVSIWLDKIVRQGLRPVAPIVLQAIKDGPPEASIVRLLKAIERHTFSASLSYYYRSNRFFELDPKIIALAARLAAKAMTIDDVSSFFEENTTRRLNTPEIAREIQNGFRSDGFYSWSLIRYFLYEYNLFLQENSKTDREKIYWPEFNEEKNDFITVEHIFPKQARNTYWQERFAQLTQKQRESLRESLGNLLPLSRPKNASLSNRPFDEKRDGDALFPTGYRFGSYAENEVAQCAEWTPTSIRDRGLRLLDFMEQRWNIPLGSEAERLRMLDVEFLP